MTSMFKISNPSESRGNTVTAREILDKAAREIDTGLAHDPALQAQMMSTMAGTYYGLGLYRQAESREDREVAIRQRVFGPRHPETLRAESDVAVDLLLEGRYAEAERMLRETLKAQREVLGSEHRELGSSGMQKIEELSAASIETTGTNLFEINPRMSNPPQEWVTREPAFWKGSQPSMTSMMKKPAPKTAN